MRSTNDLPLRTPATRAEFDAQVRLTAETMAAMTVVDAVEPPPSLRSSVLASIAEQTAAPNAPVSLAERRNRRRPWTMALAAAAAVAILVGGIGIGRTLSDNTPPPNPASEIMAAPDVHATTRDIPGRRLVPRRCSRPPKTPQSS